MIPDPSTIRDEHIISALFEAGILARKTTVRLQRYPLNFNRKDAHRRISMRVWTGEKAFCHLTVGSSLKRLARTTEAFAKANPDIACRSLFHIRHQGVDYFGQEHFGEFNLEEGLASRKIDHAVWRNAVFLLKSKLAATARPSSIARVLQELDKFEQQAVSIEWFSTLDRAFLREAIFPLIRQGATKAAPPCQWSNGDFIAKNILFDPRLGCRLIDCEFASETHFADADWFRLQRFSLIPPEADLTAFTSQPWPLWFDLYCWLQHALRISEIGSPAVVGHDLAIIGDNLRALLAAEPSFSHRSLLIGSPAPTMPASGASPSAGSLQLDWSRTSLENSPVKLSLPLNPGVWNELCYQLNPSSGRALVARLQLPPTPATLDLRSVELRSARDGSVLWSVTGPELGALLNLTGNGIRLHSPQGVRLVHFGGATYLTLPQVELGQYRDTLHLVVRIHYTPTIEEFTNQLREALEADPAIMPLIGPSVDPADKLAIEDRTPHPFAQLFYPLAGQYSQVRSEIKALPASGDWIEIELDTPALVEGDILRFDPTNLLGLVEIESLILEDHSVTSVQPVRQVVFDAARDVDLGPSANADCLRLESQDSLRYLIIGDDPILYLPPLPGFLAERQLRLVARMRFLSQVPPEMWSSGYRQLLLARHTLSTRLAEDAAVHTAKESELNSRIFGLEKTAEEYRAKLEAEIASLRAAEKHLFDEKEHQNNLVASYENQLAACQKSVAEIQTKTAEDLQAAANAHASLQSKHQSLLESLYAQNDALLNQRLRSDLAAQEIKILSTLSAEASALAATLRADLTEVQAKLGETESALSSENSTRNRLEEEQASLKASVAYLQDCLESTRADLQTRLLARENELSEAREQTLAEAKKNLQLQAELAEIRQRVLVRFDSLWRGRNAGE